MSGHDVFTTPGAFDWIVPNGVTEVTVSAWGAGVDVRPGSIDSPQRPGIRSVQPVTPGETLRVRVGGSPYADTPGFNGGGPGTLYGTTPVLDSPDLLVTTTGYGASDVRRGGDTEDHRIQVAPGRYGFGAVFDGTEWQRGGPPVATDGNDSFGLFEETVIQDKTTAASGTGAPEPAAYPAAQGGYYDDGRPVPTDRISVPGAGGGGYVGGDSGRIWRFTEATELGAPPWGWRDFFYFPTRGFDGTYFSTQDFTGVNRPDYEDLAYWNDHGRVDLEWTTQPAGWSIDVTEF